MSTRTLTWLVLRTPTRFPWITVRNGSRWGLRGGENLGNGYKVSFVLESGFESDTGLSDTKQNGRLFGREASISVSGGFGTLSFGRLPIFGSVLGANGLFRAIDPLFANYTSAFGSGAATASMWTRTDNSISYRTPTYAGLTGYAMYSFKMNTATDTGTEGKSSSDRYASLAARYQNGGRKAFSLLIPRCTALTVPARTSPIRATP